MVKFKFYTLIKKKKNLKKKIVIFDLRMYQFAACRNKQGIIISELNAEIDQ